MAGKIPTHAKRVFKGIIFDVYQWQQQMFDNTMATFEMLKRPNTVEVIATRNQKILLSKQSQPNKKDFYSLFGGRSETHEDPLVTAKRELIEESGFSSNNWDLFKIYEPLHKIDWKIYTYIARQCQKEAPQKLDSGEKIEIVECGFDEFIDIILSDQYWGNELVLDVLKTMRSKADFAKFKQKILI
ncbi:hypothetical protein A2313_01695 [Candidatus Roizmanbacteria bacterium RIFOXYB2_FULL_41_10]|uniref:Nudix hydrolase domain-containing protein n=1 Tax=Candidatus Roizmanbacteria bacterium RIFOXYA1_FULL_41_12 TaxID=1802082 RepID=A0A1F7KGP4_9BACT|nr:MAG: hypothetical protein A2262_01835 [Candidatus Roizmanbacteria bacterium RIFOXYA2_FULL_41_8]OGK67022.1 MAG: hypothetical protein A2209_03135 [Candidatus Roizmanbacteria bacterium RIFOXYA1_FULL_41_12]OGK71080.1 MAG: hypothetical protein A2313_01695 [Candidatus Roizmanbacteria bacterium RIFOXYB2_FULL_41_10]OGK71684.1 MAG: hypothetical protein A2403_04460 [Candidatus Roizmanbacteria bacterium RIFOXYC1_FULL_41_16]OGK75022.1 MAG: hypothetical protein A2575_03815 [Candidatus Roizmanbacteria bac